MYSGLFRLCVLVSRRFFFTRRTTSFSSTTLNSSVARSARTISPCRSFVCSFHVKKYLPDGTESATFSYTSRSFAFFRARVASPSLGWPFPVRGCCALKGFAAASAGGGSSRAPASAGAAAGAAAAPGGGGALAAPGRPIVGVMSTGISSSIPSASLLSTARASTVSPSISGPSCSA